MKHFCHIYEKQKKQILLNKAALRSCEPVGMKERMNEHVYKEGARADRVYSETIGTGCEGHAVSR